MMSQQTRVHLVRHAQVCNPGEIYYGRLPGFPLSEQGRRQAGAVAQALANEPLQAVFSSPLLRATETAEIIVESHAGLRLQVSHLLNEVHTPFDGRPKSELAETGWDVYKGTEAPYEQPVNILARAQRFLDQVRRRFDGQVVAVTHGDVIAVIVLWVEGRPTASGPKPALKGRYPAPASITTLVYAEAAAERPSGFECRVPWGG